MDNYYKAYAARYRAASATQRQESRQHWTRCHAANMETGRDDLIIFSGQILAAIAVIDAEEKK